MSVPVAGDEERDAAVTYCSWCGGVRAEADHERCDRRLALVDPPRYCPSCARRMVVQVDPMGWTARCSRHGESRSSDR